MEISIDREEEHKAPEQ